jgi:hypothetical protein
MWPLWTLLTFQGFTTISLPGTISHMWPASTLLTFQGFATISLTLDNNPHVASILISPSSHLVHTRWRS